MNSHRCFSSTNDNLEEKVEETQAADSIIDQLKSEISGEATEKTIENKEQVLTSDDPSQMKSSDGEKSF